VVCVMPSSESRVRGPGATRGVIRGTSVPGRSIHGPSQTYQFVARTAGSQSHHHGMPDENEHRFTEEEASRIWRRAAELQAEKRLPEAANDDAAPDDQPAAAARLSREEVAAIAREAGIERAFVDRALAEAALAAPPTGGQEAIHTRRQLAAPLAAVLGTIQEVAPAEPYRLRLRDIRAVDDGRLLDFDLEGPECGVGGALRAGDFGAGRHLVGVRAALLPAADARDHTDLLLYGVPNDLLASSRSNHDLGFGLVGGALGAATVGPAGVALLALGGAAVLAPVAVGAAAIGAAGIGLVRKLDRRSRRADVAAIERLADDVVGAVRVRRFQQQLPAGQGPDGEA